MDHDIIKNYVASESKSSTRLLRLGVVLLSIVSFFTTANGMLKYIFVDNQAIAYASSAAIQGILLALSMNLPGYLKRTWKKTTVEHRESIPWFCFSEYLKKLWSNKKNRHIWSKICCVLIVLLTIVTIFSSSWFSYVFIAETLHNDSWGTDSELLVQQAYRSQLYSARDYAHAYRLYLEESVGEKILLIEQQAASLSESGVDTDAINWASERENYGTGVVGSYMIPVINTMEAALEEGAPQESKDLAITALNDAQTNISNQLENIRRNIDLLNSNITQYANQITTLNTRIANAVEGVDTTSMVNTVNRLTRLIDSTTERQANLQNEDMMLSTALSRLPTYESALGLNNSTSPVAIRSNLIQLQAEFFQQDPDEAVMLKIATELFEDLRSAVRAGSIKTPNISNGPAPSDTPVVSGEPNISNDPNTLTEPNTSSGPGISAEPAPTDTPGSEMESLSSTNLLLQMNRLIQDLRNYADIKAIEENLERQITDLRTMENDANENSSAAPIPEGSATPGETPHPEETDNSSVPPASDEPSAPLNSPASGEPSTPSSSPAPVNTDHTDENKEDGVQWKKLWKSRLNSLKAQIGALPAYSDNGGAESQASGNILAESQTATLRNYDRDNAGKELDDIVRRYLSDHNAVYQGIIYLQSPYRALALFALMLALSFDLSGFIFGFVAQNDAQENGPMAPSASESDMAITWGMPATMNTYYILTGDYESRNGKYYYSVFKDGLRDQWEIMNIMPRGAQIATPDPENSSYAKLCPDINQSPCFAYQSSSKMDGIYTNCTLIFNDGSLLMRKNDLVCLVAPVEEFLPVHIYDPERGVHRTIPAKELGENGINIGKAVVALSEKGTRAAAIYAIEEVTAK